MGLGCRPPGLRNTNPQVVQTKPETKPFDPNAPRAPDSEGPSPEGLIARQALQNLANAKTYRAVMIIPTPSGTVKANADVNRDQGIMGHLEVPAPQGILSSSIYIAGPTILFREGTQSWSDISTTEDGRRLVNLFQNALAPNGTDVTRIVSDNTRTIEKKEDASGCMLYTLSQVDSEAQRIPFQICVRNDIPSYLTLQTSAGLLTITYSDVNGAVEVKHP
jgi:hypothetical protein